MAHDDARDPADGSQNEGAKPICSAPREAKRVHQRPNVGTSRHSGQSSGTGEGIHCLGIPEEKVLDSINRHVAAGRCWKQILASGNRE